MCFWLGIALCIWRFSFILHNKPIDQIGSGNVQRDVICVVPGQGSISTVQSQNKDVQHVHNGTNVVNIMDVE
uniref:Secreted protein n=1 Tax=Panagrellus redivivus TaxID=6233 RepID=A0A7E4W0K6_PANRE